MKETKSRLQTSSNSSPMASHMPHETHKGHKTSDRQVHLYPLSQVITIMQKALLVPSENRIDASSILTILQVL